MSMTRQKSEEKMKQIRPRSFTASALVLLTLLCVSVRRVAPPTLIDQWQSLPAISLDCREHRGDGLSLESWPQAVVWGASVVRIVPDELVTDGDLLWISTHRGLIRLNTRTLACTIFTRGARVSLAEAYALLPDGEGKLWASTRRGLLHFSGGRWHEVYNIPSGRYSQYISEVGLRRDGSFCVGLIGGRSSAPAHFCFSAENNFSQTNARVTGGALDNTDCSQWQRAASSRPRVSDWKVGHSLFYDYLTPAECYQLAATEAYAFSAVSPNGGEIWGIKDGRLFHHQGRVVEEIALPYVDVHALAADPLRGGVWMATEHGLVHAQAGKGQALSTGTRYVFQPFSFSPGLFALSETFPDYLRSLAVDTSGQVWAATANEVLRYDGDKGLWREALPRPKVDYGNYFMVAADPVRGVWVVGGLKLLYWDGVRWRAWPLALDERDSHYYNSSTALLVDESGRVWLGRSHTGVWTTLPSTQFEGQEPPALDWRHFTAQDGLADEKITTLARGPDGRVYAAHYAGISIFEPADGMEQGRWTTLPGSDADRDGWINAMAFDQATGELWVGYHGDAPLRRYEDGNWTDYPLPFAQHSIGALLVDGDGALWVGSAEGLWRWPRGANGVRSHAFHPDLHGPFIYEVLALVQDAEGRIWVGGREGVAMLKEPVGE
jgi:ligand-binding sensor domain-containing protein